MHIVEGIDKRKQEDRNFILVWIQVYRELPALWKVKSKEYNDRNKKNEAYEILLAKYRERYPHATKEDAKKKINSLRTNYRKELKKAQDSIRSGVVGIIDEIYESSLWYFEALNFLQDQPETQATSVSAVNEEDDEVGILVESKG